MNKTIEFYFDFGSPTAYLAFYRLRQLSEQYGVQIDYRPILLGGLFKATGNQSPVTVPAKGQYMMTQDLPRFSLRYGVPLNVNPYFPINTLQLMRGAYAARNLECFDSYADQVFKSIWLDGKDMGNPEVVAQVLSAAELPTQQIIEACNSPEVKSTLIDATNAAAERGLFGAPTMFFNGEMYFGQDRLDFIEEQLT